MMQHHKETVDTMTSHHKKMMVAAAKSHQKEMADTVMLAERSQGNGTAYNNQPPQGNGGYGNVPVLQETHGYSDVVTSIWCLWQADDGHGSGDTAEKLLLESTSLTTMILADYNLEEKEHETEDQHWGSHRGGVSWRFSW
jgi:hypothetical protein